MAILMQVAPGTVAVAVHAVAAPLIFVAVSIRYFAARGARQPLQTAFAFAAIVLMLDAGVVAAAVLRSFAMFESVAGTWLPLILIFVTTWAVGEIMAMMPEQPGD
jgi:hypothetical protein